jgi:hypothetical protein
MVGLLIFCVVGFFTMAFGQQAPSKIVFKAICGNGTEGCTVERNCDLSIIATIQKIRLIEESTLAGCGGVEYLDLDFNKISEISKNAFQDQLKLRTLCLDNNQIKLLQPGIFDPLTSLTKLGLQENLIEVIEDSLFSKNEKLERLFLQGNKIFAVGPNAIKHLTKLKEIWLFGNPCMHPNVTLFENPQNLGIFSYSGSDFRKWNNEDNACVSAYSLQRSLNKCNIEKENFEKKLTDLSGTFGNCKKELSETKAGNQNYQNTVESLQSELAKNQNAVKTCNLENQKISEGHKKSILDAQVKFETENDQVMVEIAENEREKNIIILVTSIIIILLLLVIIGMSVMNWKLKTKNAAKKEEIIRLDRLAPKNIYEQVDQEPEPEPEYEEVK